MAYLTLADIGRGVDPDGKISDMAELLSQCNEMIDDMPMVQANGLTTHVTTVRTALPKGTYIRYYQGTPYTASNMAQVEFGMSLLRDYSQVDKELCKLGGQESARREKEDVAHMEGLSQQQSTTLCYGNTWTTPEQFTGFSPYFNTVSQSTAQNAVNVFDCGGVNSSNASIWLIGWGERTCFGIFPKGSKAGLIMEDKGDIRPGFDSNGYEFEAYTTYFRWEAGLVVKDWRYVIRLANIDTTSSAGGLASGTPPDIFAYLSKAMVRMPTLTKRASNITKTDAPDEVAPPLNPAIYCNRTVRMYMDIQAIRDKNVLLSVKEYAGMPVTEFRGIPIRIVDQLLNTEARVV